MHNLPVMLTRFIGREQEIATCTELLRTERLLTMVGPGGCGKSRLALQVAERLLGTWADGAWLVELAGLTSPQAIPWAICAVMGLSVESGQDPLQALVDFLRARQTLLVLDNCEHLIADCATITWRLLTAAPGLRLLITSRELLRVQWERPWPVPPLSMPDSDAETDRTKLMRYDALHLFIERATPLHPEQRIPDAHLPALVRLCHRLDGLPLAIELAAAQTRLVAIPEIESELSERFRRLSGGWRMVPERQGSLSATLNWSYQMLNTKERRLCQNMAVFAGSFDRRAAQAICGGAAIGDEEFLALLRGLVEKSIIQPREGGDVRRYQMLQTIKQFSTEQRSAATSKQVRQRYTRWYRSYAEEGYGLPPTAWFTHIHRELPNLQQALAWLREKGEQQEALHLIAALYGGAIGEPGTPAAQAGEALVQQALVREVQRPTETIDAVLALEQPALAQFVDRYAISWMTGGAVILGATLGALLSLPAVPTWQPKLGDRLTDLGPVPVEYRLVLEAQRRYTDAQPLLQRAYTPLGLDCLYQMGKLAFGDGAYQQAKAYLTACLAYLREQYPGSVPFYEQHEWMWRYRQLKQAALTGLGLIAEEQGEYHKASLFYLEALCSALFDIAVADLPRLLRNLGFAFMGERQWARAAHCFVESFWNTFAGDAAARSIAADCLDGLAAIAREARRLEHAATLGGIADRLRIEGADYMRLPCRVRAQEEAVYAIKQRLGATAFEAAYGAGKAMEQGAMLGYVAGFQTAWSEPAPGNLAYPFTEQQLRVIELVGQGKSRKEIAGELYLSPRTVQTHEEHVRERVKLPSRAALAAWAVKNGFTKGPTN